MEGISPCPELAGSVAAAANSTGSKQKLLCVIPSSRLVKFALGGNSVKQGLYSKPTGFHTLDYCKSMFAWFSQCCSHWAVLQQHTVGQPMGYRVYQHHLGTQEIFAVTALFSLNTCTTFSFMLLAWDQQGNAERAPETPNSLRFSPALSLLLCRK